ncbi:flagellar basal body rod protein FlgC [Asticcacaulis sp.]|uniref:flagellar basal body rod protein FlgC n=1 Tax=Asticcacaulis sp. TaxID=1872648 RepID=UPI0031DDA6E4
MPIDKVPSDAAVGAAAVSGLRAQQARMRIIAENIANSASTGSTPGADPYRRQMPVFQATLIDGALGVELAQVKTDPKEFPKDYDPSHPAADADGYVKRPNVQGLIESMDMRDAQRAYEANLNVIETSHAMENAAMQMLKK